MNDFTIQNDVDLVLECFLAPSPLPSFLIPAYRLKSESTDRNYHAASQTVYIQNCTDEEGPATFVKIDLDERNARLGVSRAIWFCEFGKLTIGVCPGSERTLPKAESGTCLRAFGRVDGSVLIGKANDLAEYLQTILSSLHLPAFANLEVIRFIDTYAGSTNSDRKSEVSRALDACKEVLFSHDAECARYWFEAAQNIASAR